MKKTITSANAEVTLINELFPAGLKFEKFSTDNAWSTETVEQIVSQMGVDGHLSHGYVCNPVPVTFTFSPDSDTAGRLDYMAAAQDVSKGVILCQMVIKLKSLGKTITLMNGALNNGQKLPAGERVLGNVPYTFTFESAVPSPS